MLGVVVFDFQKWIEAFPEFANTVNAAQAQRYFDTACLYLNNTPYSIVNDINERSTLLNLLVAHIAQLGSSTGGTSGVGRVGSVSRGSVSVTFDGANIPKDAGWFAQTQYGYTYYQATARYRQMMFTPGRPQPAMIFP